MQLNATNYNGLQAWITKIDEQMATPFHTLIVTHNCDTITWYQEVHMFSLLAVKLLADLG